MHFCEKSGNLLRTYLGDRISGCEHFPALGLIKFSKQSLHLNRMLNWVGGIFDQEHCDKKSSLKLIWFPIIL